MFRLRSCAKEPLFIIQAKNLLYRNCTATNTNIERPATFVDDDDVDTDSTKSAIFFDKSGLLPQHKKLLHKQRPYSEPHSWIHLTEKYQRKLFGRYGLASGIDPRICFPKASDVKKQKEYLKVAFPHTLQDMMNVVEQQNAERRAKIEQREIDVASKLQKLDQWKKDLIAKIDKKEREALAARQKKERLVEEVRRHFGYKVDPREERFKELLVQKEREIRKTQKEARRKAKDDQMISKLLEKSSDVENAKDAADK